MIKTTDSISQLSVTNIAPLFPSEDARKQQEKEISQILFRIISKYRQE